MRLACFAIVLVGCSGGSFEVASGTTDAQDDTFATTDTSNDARDDSTVTPDTPPPPPDDTSGGVVDTGPPCPKPTSMKTWDVSEYKDCGVIRTKYMAAVEAARACTCDADCTSQIDPDLCHCVTYVSPGNDEMTLAVALAARYEKLMCVAACPAIPCAPPSGSKCLKTSMGMRCQDI